MLTKVFPSFVLLLSAESPLLRQLGLTSASVVGMWEGAGDEKKKKWSWEEQDIVTKKKKKRERERRKCTAPTGGKKFLSKPEEAVHMQDTQIKIVQGFTFFAAFPTNHFFKKNNYQEGKIYLRKAN